METLIIKYLAGEASPEETKQVLDWIASRPRNDEAYAEIKNIFDEATRHYDSRDLSGRPINIDAEWSRFLAAVEKPAVQLYPIHKTTPAWMKIAAVLLIILVSGFVISWFVRKNSDVVFKADNAPLAVMLPDGTHVTLNGHSKLSYHSSFGIEKRDVELSGEAFFDVVHDAQKPFIVQAGAAIIEDVGTSFNVRSSSSDKSVEVVVQSGAVKFSAPSIGKDVKLDAGQKGIFKRETSQLVTSINTDPNFNAWHTRKLVFVENDLRTVIETLNNTYGAHIVLATDASASCIVTVTFDHQSLESVLHVLETTLDLKIKTTGDRIEITHAGCS